MIESNINFPSQAVSDLEKLSEEYGLKIAQAIKQDGTIGDLYFNDLLNDWAKFDITKRTKHDATISSGLAIMACNKNRYTPHAKRNISSVPLKFKSYDNKGYNSKIIT